MPDDQVDAPRDAPRDAPGAPGAAEPGAPDAPPGAGPSPVSPAPPARRRPQILGPAGLIVMVAAILLFTAVSIVIEVRSNLGTRFRASVDVVAPIREDAVRVVFHVTNTGTRAGRPDVCEATLLDIRGARAGTATVRLRTPIQPGETIDEQAVGTVAQAPVNGVVNCRSLSPS